MISIQMELKQWKPTVERNVLATQFSYWDIFRVDIRNSKVFLNQVNKGQFSFKSGKKNPKIVDVQYAVQQDSCTMV